ncbi:hypothetical protein CW304_17530 [Bacillus sp. UFRGS-B20]|nr:hypothetical protein CW304_17530 [Bacillus sp. UFRGS-B20]
MTCVIFLLFEVNCNNFVRFHKALRKIPFWLPIPQRIFQPFHFYRHKFSRQCCLIVIVLQKSVTVCLVSCLLTLRKLQHFLYCVHACKSP